MDRVVVDGNRIVSLYKEAQGFRFCFFKSYENAFSVDYILGKTGDQLSVMATNGCFSIELYLKLLCVISTFNSNSLNGNHKREHKLDELYNDLVINGSIFANELDIEYLKCRYKQHASFKDFLHSINLYFVDWRYSYDKDELLMNLNELSDVLNSLEKYSDCKIAPVMNTLINNGIKFIREEQVLVISDTRDIKMD